MAKKVAKIIWHVSKVFLITLLVVLLVRVFVVESFTVSSSQMETSLQRGDKVLVNKTAYGVRMPITLLAIPFAFDSFFGYPSYSNYIQLNYNRIFASPIGRNDVVVFNNPMEIEKPIDRRSICISRCIAVSGDTIMVDGFNYRINGKEYITSPDFLLKFKFQKAQTDSIKGILAYLSIPLRKYETQDSLCFASFNRYEAFIINQNLNDSAKIQLAETGTNSYKIQVPKKGLKITIDESSLPIYHKVIEAEMGKDKIKAENGILLINGVKAEKYTFLFDYYWFLSDNVDESLDSRYLGFISEKDVIGKATYIWSSSNKNGIHWDRIFTSVK